MGCLFPWRRVGIPEGLQVVVRRGPAKRAQTFSRPMKKPRRCHPETERGICFCGEEQKKQIPLPPRRDRNDSRGTFCRRNLLIAHLRRESRGATLSKKHPASPPCNRAAPAPNAARVLPAPGRISTPTLKLTSARGSSLRARPALVSAPAKPKPWMSPKANATAHGLQAPLTN